MKTAVMSDVQDVSASSVKCVVWDLDGTIWDGVISEQDSGNLMPRKSVIDVIKKLDARGIVNSIASKNEHDIAQKSLESAGLWEYFLLPQIHWGAKSESVRTIATMLGIGVDSIALIDDEERERAEVKSVFRCVRTYTPNQIDTLLQLPEFSVPTSETTSSRRQMYIEEFKRKEFRDSSGLTNEQFLSALNLEMTVTEGVTPEIEHRIIELLRRANNWHMTGHRDWDSNNLHACNGNEAFVLSYSLKDRFGEYGCIGVSLLEIDKSRDSLCVHELVMSCRAASKAVDVAIIYEIAQSAVSHGVNKIVFRLFKTDRNMPMQRFLRSICTGHISSNEDGFEAEIPDVSVFLHLRPKCFVRVCNSINPQAKDKPMKAKKGFSIKTLGERCYLTADTSDASKAPCLILLNKTGCLLWELLQKPQTEDSLAEGLSQKFGIGKDEVIDDVHDFIVAATNANLIEDV